MVYRLLGGVSVVIGGIFALVALLVLLPFLNNFNMSLLVLTAIFAIFSWVFLAIGWQLLHPPRPQSGSEAASQAEAEEPPSLREAPGIQRAPEPPAAEPKETRERHLSATRTL
jgi:hypothetical protein